MKSIISAALFAVIMMLATSCSTIWDEASCAQEEHVYAQGELPLMVSVYEDHILLTFLSTNLTHYVYLDGKLISKVQNEKNLTLNNLSPGTEYHLYITAMKGDEFLVRDTKVTTRMPDDYVIGWREMNLYEYDEAYVKYAYPLANGDFIDYTYRLYNNDDYHFLRRTDANGNVIWRSNLVEGLEASVSEEGIAAWSYGRAFRVNPETGSVLCKYNPAIKELMIQHACVCKDGGLAVVGQRDGKAFFTRLDANGNVVKETDIDSADILYCIHENADGNSVAIGRRGEYTWVKFTLDASGRIIDEKTDTSKSRDLSYRADIIQSVRDSKGNIYFLGLEEGSGKYGAKPDVIIIKIDDQGNIAWIHGWGNDLDEYFPSNMHFIDDDKLCMLYSGRKNTMLSILTTGNELLADVLFNGNYSAIYAWPENEQYTQFNLFDKYGRIIRLTAK